MAADFVREDESGQSVLEFLLMLPLIVGITVITVRVNMAIQVSIVNQKYSRAQALFLAFNSPEYPARDADPQKWQRSRLGNQLVMGVSSELIPAAASTVPPVATTIRIARNPAKAEAKPTSMDTPAQNGWVRVLGTVTLCTQSTLIRGGSGLVEATDATLGEPVTPKSFAYCAGAYPDSEGTP